MNEIFVIMNKGEVYHAKFFEKMEWARNYVKMSNPKKKFKERVENEFVDVYTGLKLKVVELTNSKSLETKLREGMEEERNNKSYYRQSTLEEDNDNWNVSPSDFNR